tara:strand:- start:1926 stop:2483 length:558 start_codon:yes stop_codon:yes gene_type:complete
MIKKWKIDLKVMKSNTYLLPILDITIKFKFLDKLVGSYLYNNKTDKDFCVLYKFSGKEDYTQFERNIMRHEMYIGHEDYEDYVLYKFKVSKELEKTIELYKLGMFSQFPEDHKNAIISFNKKRGYKNWGRIKMILTRDEALRIHMEKNLKCKISKGSELSSPPDLSLEYFSNYVKEIKIDIEDTF